MREGASRGISGQAKTRRRAEVHSRTFSKLARAKKDPSQSGGDGGNTEIQIISLICIHFIFIWKSYF